MAEMPKKVDVKVKLELSLTDHTVRVLDAMTANKGVLLPTINQLMAEAWQEGADAYETRRARDESLPLTNPYLKGAAE
jgi:hypothetical protein